MRENSYFGDSLTNSNVTSKQWNFESRMEKENIPFTRKDEEKFAKHCSELYNLRSGDNLVNEITR